MRPAYITDENLSFFIDSALREDVEDGDHTTLATVPADKMATAELKIKGDGVIAGIEFSKFYWNKVDPNLKLSYKVKDGSAVRNGDLAFTVEGSVRSILTGERLLLNCMQRMSGIATKTKRVSDLLKGSKAKVLDTRKTTPNFRMLEKWAVYIGGGINHRYGLFDQILLKDNHVDISGGITNALKAAKTYIEQNNLNLKIEIETRSIKEVKEVLKAGIGDIIMFDNMMPSDMKIAIDLIKGKLITEASGGITELNINDVAETGVDFISVGALTHSYESLDLSLKIK